MLKLLKSAVVACVMAWTASAQEQIGSWTVERYIDPIDDNSFILTFIKGDNTWFGILCRENLTAVLTNVYRMPIDPNVEIGIRVGENGPSSAFWTVDNQIAFNFSVLPLIEEILSTDSTTLVVRYWTAGSRRITDILDTTGAEEAIQVITAACPVD